MGCTVCYWGKIRWHITLALSSKPRYIWIHQWKKVNMYVRTQRLLSISNYCIRNKFDYYFKTLISNQSINHKYKQFTYHLLILKTIIHLRI